MQVIKNNTTANETELEVERLKRNFASNLGVNRFAKKNINKTISFFQFQVQFIAPATNNPSGKLFLYPINDTAFYVEIYYLNVIEEEQNHFTIHKLRFEPDFFTHYPNEVLMAHQPFSFNKVTEVQFPVCNLSFTQLNEIAAHKQNKLSLFSDALQQSQIAMQLLGRALTCITIPFLTCQVPACRFLSCNNEREKIAIAQQIIEQNPEIAYTIPELAKKVAINECYLKKGFKAITGKTVHEYRETTRMNVAKSLLAQQKYSVTEVAFQLGYSSISHFSAAFKRSTGLKPCELLS